VTFDRNSEFFPFQKTWSQTRTSHLFPLELIIVLKFLAILNQRVRGNLLLTHKICFGETPVCPSHPLSVDPLCSTRLAKCPQSHTLRIRSVICQLLVPVDGRPYLFVLRTSQERSPSRVFSIFLPPLHFTSPVQAFQV